MAEDFGPGVSRTLSAQLRQFLGIKFQSNKPPLDSELNLLSQIEVERAAEIVRANMHSGFLMDVSRPSGDYGTSKSWSNFFVFGTQEVGEDRSVIWANLNGWLIPVAGTGVSSEGDVRNIVTLHPAPTSDSRIDFVFLEAWMAAVAPNPSTANKPNATTVWKYGNVEHGAANIVDDIEDPTIGFESTERLQLQYRLRVMGQGSGAGASVDLNTFADGLDDPNVFGQGTSSSPLSGITFANMRHTLGDPSLWRAGDGDATNALGTFDGYVYAIPVCAIFRRNSASFTAVTTAGNPNQNGSFNRNPSAILLSDPRVGAKAFTTATLTNDLDATFTGVVQIEGLAGSGIDDSNLTLANTFLLIGDEIVGVSLVDTGASPGEITIPVGGRGRSATSAVRHVAGTGVDFYTIRPDGLFSDEVSERDILDLRRAVSPGEWDYSQILMSNLGALLQGDLRTVHKQSAVGDTQGPVVVEVDYLHADGSASNPNHTEAVDGPDGIRTIFSDSAALQSDVTLLLDPNVALNQGFTASTFDQGVDWTLGATGLKPSGWMNNTSGAGGWNNGSMVFLFLGGETGSEGARATFRDGAERAVRFVGPQEYWKAGFPIVDPNNGRQDPVLVKWDAETTPGLEPGGPGFNPDTLTRPGPFYPLQENTFEKPFLFLGGLVHPSLAVTGVDTVSGLGNARGLGEVNVGIDFDAPDAFFPTGDIESLDPSQVSTPLLRGERTLYSMLTDNGRDRSGLSSDLYVILYGDDATPDNNGVFRVVGAGTAGYTDLSASATGNLPSTIVVQSMSEGWSAFVPTVGKTVDVQFRSQHTNSEDGQGFASGPTAASAVLVLTDVEAVSSDPWTSQGITSPIQSKMFFNLTLQYHPGRGATARIPDDIWRVAVRNGGSEYLRQPAGVVDSTFPGESGAPSDEVFFDRTHLQLWNRLPSRGFHAPDAPNYGGNIVASSEQDREAEVFFDNGSKTLLLRPYKSHLMTMTVVGSAQHDADETLVGPSVYPSTGDPKDGGAIFDASLNLGVPLPPETMPRFGRQDIPYHVDLTGNGSGNFLEGINHLFKDSTTLTNPGFKLIGGVDNLSGVSPLHFQTGAATGLSQGEYGTISGTGIDGYQAWAADLPGVVSSDLGSGLEGIELPPYLGIVRLYGVYERSDFIAKGGATFEADRVTLAVDPATNLLRSDADKQTLFICQDGSPNNTISEPGDHTYIIPTEAFDVSLIPTFVAGNSFTDFDYVVVATVFGFSRGWINENNYVLVRRHDGVGGTPALGELQGVDMVLPSPATLNDQFYVGYNRTVYQGDPFGTRGGTTQVLSDYEHRYGQVSIPDAFELSKSIEQFDANGNPNVETPNTRSLQILSSMDFYTTLGTGKVGGLLYPGTPLDAGFTQPLPERRIPGSPSRATYRVLTRAFSEGQKTSSNRATLPVGILDPGPDMADTLFRVTRSDGVVFEFKAVTGVPTAGQFQIVLHDAVTTAQNLVLAIQGESGLNRTVAATTEGRVGSVTSSGLTLIAVPTGAEGNSIKVSIVTAPSSSEAWLFYRLTASYDNTQRLSTGGSLFRQVILTSTHLQGGVDFPFNAGAGNSSVDLTGMTERLPLGILLQDSDFMGENINNDASSSLKALSGGLRPVQTVLPLTSGGSEFTRFLGTPGELVAMSDGAVQSYQAFNSATAPAGSKKFRIFRGGGSSFVLSGDNPGGPLDWVGESFPASSRPVLKGAVLACKALLVRNFSETAFAGNRTVNEGDELQMVILTYGVFGEGDSQSAGVDLEGVISPTGFGEGYAASDRYRLRGRPMFHGRTRTHPDPDAVPLAPFSGRGVE